MDDALAITHPIKHIFKDIIMYVSNEERREANPTTSTTIDRKRKTSTFADRQTSMSNESSFTPNNSSNLPESTTKKANNREQKTSRSDVPIDSLNQEEAD
uniref:Reverse transcriptase zinc-binding domain-containing protein n=1 Tax=Strongyloides stercoralis TaxID=6248 RepID=A0A0K0DS53_STRER